MTNTNPFWKTLLLAVVLLVGSLYALPNLFGSDPSVQVSGRNSELTSADMDRVARLLEAEGFTDAEIRREDTRFLALFKSEDEQIKARDVIASNLNANNYSTTLNLEPASPAWLRSIAAPMNLGLDLRGGVHFLMEVDMDSAINSAEERFVPAWKRDELWKRAKSEVPASMKIVRVGVTLGDLTPSDSRQLDMLLNDDPERQKWEIVTQAVDGLNARYGKSLVTMGKWVVPAGGNLGGKISFTRIPRAEDFW